MSRSDHLVIWYTDSVKCTQCRKKWDHIKNHCDRWSYLHGNRFWMWFFSLFLLYSWTFASCRAWLSCKWRINCVCVCEREWDWEKKYWIVCSECSRKWIWSQFQPSPCYTYLINHLWHTISLSLSFLYESRFIRGLCIGGVNVILHFFYQRSLHQIHTCTLNTVIAILLKIETKKWQKWNVRRAKWNEKKDQPTWNGSLFEKKSKL